MKKPYLRMLLPLGLCCATPNLAAAAFDFEMDFRQQRIAIEGDTRLEANAIGFNYNEYSGPISLELSLGRAAVDHAQNSMASAYSPGGFYAGLGIKTSTQAHERLRAGAELSYTYFGTTDSDFEPDRLEIDWTQAEAQLWLSLRLAPRLDLYGCAIALSLDGKQRLKGTAPAQQDLKNSDSGGYCGGLRLEMPDNGYIGLEANGGAKQGGLIYFGKRFN